jgi:PAS domain S-box-containing protein
LIPVQTRVKKVNISDKYYLLGISKDLTVISLANERFQKAFYRNPTIMTISDFESGIFLDVNEAFTNVLGYEKSEVIGKSSSEIFDVFTPSLRRQIFLDFDSKGRVENIKMSFKKKNGEIFDGLLFGEIIKTGNFKYLLTLINDITVHEKLIYDIEKSEQRWNYALFSSDLGVWDWNLETNQVYFSKQWKNMLGFEENEVENKLSTWETLVHPKDIQSCYDDISKHLRGEIELYKNTHRIKCKDGKYKWILDTGRVVEFSIDGSPIRFIGTHRDITAEKEAELTIIEQKEWVKTILDSAMAGIIIIEKETSTIFDINQAGTNILGYSKNELIGSNCKDYFCSGNGLCCCKDFNNDNPINLEREIFNKNGKTIQILKSVSEKIISGKSFYIESFIDISDIKSKEQAIADNERMLNLLFTQSLAGFFFMMLDNPVEWNDSVNKDEVIEYVFENQRITSINNAMAEQYKLTVDDLIGLTPNDLFKHNPEYGKSLWRKLFNEGRVHLDTIEYRSDGSEMNITGDYTCIYDKKGRISGHFGIQYDITDQVLTDKMLALKSEELERFFEATIDLLLISDYQGNIIRANKAWEVFLGISNEELLKHNFFDFIHPDDIILTQSAMSRLGDNLKVRGFVNRYKNNSGKYRSIEWLAIPYENLIYASARDVTERIKDRNEILELLERTRDENEEIEANLYEKNILINELEDIKQQLTNAISEKDKFLSVIAHDLRSPLNGFLGLTKMMSEELYNFSMNEMQDIATTLKNSAGNIYELLENLLDWSIYQRGMMDFIPVKLNISKLILIALKLQQTNINSKKIRIINLIEEDKFFVNADEYMINTILRNILSNAIKFSSMNGKVTLDASQNVENITITIADEGIGIPEELLSKIFIIGEKTSRPGTEGEKSTGLGLLLCKEYTFRNGGSFEIESLENIGTKVILTLPRYIG